MKKRFSTTQALLMSVLSLVLCVSMLIGTTFAWFTDSVTSARNTIQSGNLDVELYYATTAADVNADNWVKVDSTTDIFGYNLWEPGYTKIAYFKVVNNGSLALKYQLTADVYSETKGVNKSEAVFSLSDYIKTAVVDTTATRESILAMAGTNLKDSVAMGANSLAAGAEEVIGFALWMPTTVGNEANHNGTAVPSIEFGINLLATQQEAEIDSFGSDYDASATLPVVARGTTPVEPGVAYQEIYAYNANGGKAGSATVMAASIDPDAANLEFSITERPTVDGSVAVGSAQTAKTYDITVEGLAAGNTTPVKVEFHVGKGLTDVKLYHNNVLVSDAVYNSTTGNIIFESTSFSPFTVVYAKEAEVEEDDDETTTAIPEASVVDVSDTYAYTKIDWESYGSWSPDFTVDANPYLESVYTFSIKDTVDEIKAGAYADWHCDFYVKLDKDLGENQIFLGGNYGDWGWIGFHNGDVTLDANTELPLLGSVTSNPWTYAQVADFVGTFTCGVGDVNNALEGATFTVMLRLTNPDDENEFYNVATINHTFDDTVVVSDGNELQDAINNGAENITLGGDIDLSQGGIVIP